MKLKLRTGSSILFVLFCLVNYSQESTASQPPIWSTPPRLIVGVVVDQMRTDLIYRYWNNFGNDGFKRSIIDGAFARNAHFDYAPTFTGPGHASIYTGTTPAYHGIVSNDMFIRATGGGLYCAEDEQMSGVGCEGPSGQRSPVNLLSSTIADELERRTARHARTIGVAIKDRGAILPIGRTGDAAFWYDPASGDFVTSTWYRDALPDWLKEFNARELPEKYLNNKWDLILPRERYTQVLPDDNPYEIAVPGATKAVLPLDLAAISTDNPSLLANTPWGNTLTTDVALAALAGEALGADEVPDLLAISYSSTDMLGHRVGPRALELEDMYIRLDAEIARLLKALDEQVGKDRYLFFLTADHGTVDVPGYLKDLRASAGYYDQGKLRERLEPELIKHFGEGKWVDAIVNEQVFLNWRTINEKKVDASDVQRVIVNVLLQEPEISHAIGAVHLVSNTYTDRVLGNLQRGFMPQRSGDVIFALRPGMLDLSEMPEGKGTSHRSVWNYDTHVPVIFFGYGVRSADVTRRISITDIAPTIAIITGMTMPDACIGEPIEEFIRH